MKNSALIIVILLFSLGCSNDDNRLTPISGNWKLVEVKLHGFQGASSIDYSGDNITYNFKTNGILIVTGGENVGHTVGEYKYFFGDDHLGANSDPKVLLVKINDSKWTYNLSNGKMTLGKSYVDGPDLVFTRK